MRLGELSTRAARTGDRAGPAAPGRCLLASPSRVAETLGVVPAE